MSIRISVILILILVSASALAQFPPAAFTLYQAGKPNPTLFRMDHTSRLPGCVASQGLELDTLRLQWQPALWTGADSTKNNPGDPLRYEWTAIVDTGEALPNGTRNSITFTFPSWENGAQPELRLSGDVLYPTLFRPSSWPVDEPDTIVIRIRWFVRAYNSVGSVYSDTAGHTVLRGGDTRALTAGLVLSYNRPPQAYNNIPVIVEPVNNGIIAGVDAKNDVYFIWTPGDDRNVRATFFLGGFRTYNPLIHAYDADPSGRSTDTMLYQWVAQVVRTVPPGRGAAPGTRLVVNAGPYSGVPLSPAQQLALFGEFNARGADSVVLDHQIFVKDAAWTDNVPIDSIPFPYELDGTVRADTGLWSRFGCRPHVVASSVFRATLARAKYPPAPFVLSNIYVMSPDLFRMDHVGMSPLCPDFLADSLRLRWVKPLWSGVDSARNDPLDTVRYEWHALVDSGGTSVSNAIHVSAPSAKLGLSPSIVLGGDFLVRQLMRPSVWPTENPDSVVRRLRWFVRAYNSAGSTYSDTAGVSRFRVSPLPTRAVLLSFNRPPENTVAAIRPLDKTVIIGLTATHPPIPIEWTEGSDANISAGQRIGGFKVFDVAGRRWIDDPQKRTIDTLTYQFVSEVIETKPAGKGAPIGTMFIAHTGTNTDYPLENNVTTQMFAGYSGPTAADTVVLRWRIDVKDFNQTDDLPLHDVLFRYKENGELQNDTARWSQYGCRPHSVMGSWHRLTLVRNSSTDAPPLPEAGAAAAITRVYPNPFRYATQIEYTVTQAGAVHLDVFDMLGTRVATVLDTHAEPGLFTVTWKGQNAGRGELPAGLYLVRLRTGNTIVQRLITLLR